jgi:hypothetical protein
MKVYEMENLKKNRECQMISNKVLYCILTCFITAAIGYADITEQKLTEIKARHSEHMKKLCESGLLKEGAFDLQYAFSAFYLGKEIDEANLRLENAYKELMQDHAGMNPEAAERFKWQMRWWLRIYYLFGNDLSVANREKLDNLFWNYACRKSSVKRAGLKYIWVIQGSENHDMMDLSNAFLSLQAIKDNPEYSSRKLPDGFTVLRHYQDWMKYYKEYCRQRALKGFYVEVASPIYGKYFLPELINIFDFAQDAELKRLMKNLLHATWADWAVDQINGVRGGGRTRAYQGHYSWRGESDSWWAMSKPLIGDSSWTDAAQHNHVNNGYAYVIGSSSYRLPDLILELALDSEGRGEYEYISQRPGKMHYSPQRPALEDGCWYDLDMDNPHNVRYDYCTPNYIMGSWWIDPAYNTVFRVDQKKGHKADENYSALFCQNRWQGVIFDTDVNARVYPQCLAEPDENGDRRVTYNQHQAVQVKNIMLVQKNKNSEHAGLMRIYWAKGMENRLHNEAGYWILQEGDSYLAVKAFSLKKTGQIPETRWVDANWLEIEEEFSPVVFVTGRRNQYPSFESFVAYVKTHTYSVEKERFNYIAASSEGKQVKLTLSAGGDTLAMINGEPINLKLDKPYDCPYLTCNQERQMVTVRYKGKVLRLGF